VVSRVVRVAVGMIVVTSMTFSPAIANAAEPACTKADAHLLLQQLERGAFLFFARGETDRRIVDVFQRCQYRLWFDGATFTFRENDVFLGGSVFFWSESELEEMGWTRRQAVADLEAIEARVWLAPVLPDGSIGELVEQQLRQTPVKTVPHTVFGKSVATQVAFIARLPAGDYVSVYQESKPGEPVFEATVHLHIVPAEA
jgi:hypothetical protein